MVGPVCVPDKYLSGDTSSCLFESSMPRCWRMHTSRHRLGQTHTPAATRHIYDWRVLAQPLNQLRRRSTASAGVAVPSRSAELTTLVRTPGVNIAGIGQGQGVVVTCGDGHNVEALQRQHRCWDRDVRSCSWSTLVLQVAAPAEHGACNKAACRCNPHRMRNVMCIAPRMAPLLTMV